ncbi:MAG: EAL domain-containing protein [Pseudomonadota bacterium]
MALPNWSQPTDAGAPGHARLVEKALLLLALALVFLGGVWSQVNLVVGLLLATTCCFGVLLVVFRTDKAATANMRLAEQDLGKAKAALETALNTQNSNVQLLVKLQEIGDLVGWWYDPHTNEVFYADAKNSNMDHFLLDDPKADAYWQNRLRDLVGKVMQTGEKWDKEVESQDHAGNPIWLRSIGEAQKKDGEIVRVIGLVQDITDRISLANQLVDQANRDELTSLANRRFFNSALKSVTDNVTKVEHSTYLFFMDLDQFKVVNDTSGHKAGDELLRLVSGILTKCVRTNDVVARLGGDEFAIILQDCPKHVAHSKAEEIRSEVESLRFSWQDQVYSIGISIGVVDCQMIGGDYAELLQLADAACYEAKASGRNRVYVIERTGRSISKHRGEMRWVQRINEAMDRGQFSLYGQPIVSVRGQDDEDFQRLEILLRLRDVKNNRLIPPGAFLPAAERYGLSAKLDRWVLRHLLTMLYVHNELGEQGQRYWVNLSGCSVGDDQFVDYLVAAIKDIGLPPGMINFEITETAVIRKLGAAKRLISQLHELGCEFALDDFGSGVSSIEYLKKLPVDYLKIDGKFVKNILENPVDRIFVKSIIDVAQQMGIRTVAEFVENGAILSAVRNLGIDYVQGFYIHRPVLIAPEFPINRENSLHSEAGIPTAAEA